MKKLLLILPLLVACKSTKKANCDAYGHIYIDRDTITITTEHINYDNRCSAETTLVTCIVDTLYFKPKQK